MSLRIDGQMMTLFAIDKSAPCVRTRPPFWMSQFAFHDFGGKMFRVVLLVWSFLILYGEGYEIEPGPLVRATEGAVWPKPQVQEELAGFFVIKPTKFSFQPIGENCEVLQDAIERYWAIIQKFYSQKVRNAPKTYKKRKDHRSLALDEDFQGDLSSLEVYLQTPCNTDEFPSLDMDESYTLNVSTQVTPNALLTAKSLWGILRGLETFTQLIHIIDETLVINATNIHDYPRFSHRGLLLDTSRHYLPLDIILKMLDAMSYNKMNVFHWHITDDQSFPFQSIKFPELSNRGAYDPFVAIYSPNDVKKVLTYARFRGIRVIPEFDTPGHTRSWGVGVPELLTQCYVNGTFRGTYGPMDPSRNFTYSFMEELLDEISQVFPDNYLHLGGDEVDFDCWESNPDINNFMASINITGNYSALEDFFLQRVMEIVNTLNKSAIVWEELFTNGVEIENSTVVQVWKTNYIGTLEKVTTAGKFALLSSCWYLDHIGWGGDWGKYYECEPYDFPGTDDQKKLILGGEACMWGESVNEYNILQRVWPRASATAEILWSAQNASTIEHAARRLEEHACRMNYRGIPAQPPNGPGYCY